MRKNLLLLLFTFCTQHVLLAGSLPLAATPAAVVRPSGNAPVITSFTPGSGSTFTVITITGSDFTGTTAVRFNGVAAYSFTVVSGTQITAQAPINLTPGPISVTTPDGTATSTQLFIPPPQLTAFTPDRDFVGASVSITGLNLVQVSAVRFNGLAATFTPVSATEVVAVVPAAATTGRIQVTTPAGTVTSAYAYTVRTTLSATGLTPAPNALRVPGNSSVSAQFSSPVTAASVGGMRVFGSKAWGRRTGTLSGAGSSAVTFVPTRGFAPGEQVTVTLPGSLSSATGVALNSRVSQFLTAVGGSGRGLLTPGQAMLINGNWPRITSGDFDNDGDMDLVVTRSHTTPSLYLNNGNGTYAGPSYLNGPGGGYSMDDVALGDVDGDGDLDMVFSDASSYVGANVSVFLNNGAGTFTAGSPVAVPIRSNRVLLGDVDADGDLDLLISFTPSSGTNGQTVFIRLNDGTGVFSGTGEVFTDTNSCMVLGDVDGDSDLDLVTCHSIYSSATIWKNDGTGTFTRLKQGVYNDVSVGEAPVSVALGDLDGDGDLDLVTANRGSASFTNSSVSVRINNGAGVFSGTTNTTTLGNVMQDLALGDLDADGDLDMAVSVYNYSSPSVVLVRQNNGLGSFTTLATTPTGGWPDALTLVDSDGDADLDIVVGVNLGSQTSNSMQLMLNQPLTPSATAGSHSPALLAVYPNPAHQTFTVQLPVELATQPVRLAIINALGQTVYSAEYPASHGPTLSVAATGLPAGLYQIRITGGNQQLGQPLVLE